MMKKKYFLIKILFINFSILVILYFLYPKNDTSEFNQKDLVNYINTLDTLSVYLAFKGTNTKPGNIAKNYNIKNKYVSHVGLLYHENYWKIINVTNVKKNNNNLYLDSINQFYNEKLNIKYAAIYQIKPIKKAEILDKIHSKLKKTINFDLKFDKDNEDYYCSEFVIDLINNVKNIKLSTRKKEITNLQHKFYLEKDSLEYYPVDIFFYDKNFIKIYESPY